MLYLIIGLLLLSVVLVFQRWHSRASPTHQRALLRRASVFAGCLLIITAAILTARNAVQLAVPAAVLGLYLLFATGRSVALPHAAGGTRDRSRIVTDFLEMELDHDSGTITGRVLRGLFAGRLIETLKPAELALLWQDVRAFDPASAQLIEAYLDRTFPSWREDVARGEQEMSGPDGRMTAAEAYEILGLAPGASDEDIRRAHRELMLKLHPDRGGSTYLAAKVNEAKDVLLRKQ
ncbi:MAG: DnaJ domain-containing protein [Hyphomicrobiaceae bacterium]|nr:DnaJ domain-containing protein [Hyphomicrobiaceae bacterium]